MIARRFLKSRSTQPMGYNGEYFKSWVRHFRHFNPGHLKKLASRLGIADTSAAGVARALCEAPELWVDAVHEKIQDPEAWEIVRELALQHDLFVGLTGTSRRARKVLHTYGLLSKVECREALLPAAGAAILAPLLHGAATLPTLLGTLPIESLRTIARNWDVGVNEPRIPLVLTLSERLKEPGVVGELLSRLEEPDYLGAALVAVELGGVCYWQEVFGVDLEDGGSSAKVVPFMRSDEREAEQHAANALLELGVIYRLEESPHAMLAVPEEFWIPIWAQGRAWLAEWVADGIALLNELATARHETAGRVRLQDAIKWFACELAVDSDLRDGNFESLRSRGNLAPEEFDRVVDFVGEMGLLTMPEASPDLADKLLDLPRVEFTRQILQDWSIGYVGGRADQALSRALGLDEPWRQIMRGRLRDRSVFVPQWMNFEGVESEMTGCGTLRVVDVTDPSSVLADEFGAANNVVRLTKLIFLDLISTLDANYAYPVATVGDLLLLSASFAVFVSSIHALEDVRMPLYIPLQRASFMTDPFHLDAFESWNEDILRELLVPLGVAHLDTDSHIVSFDAQAMRIMSPPDTTDEARAELLRELLMDPEFDPAFPSGATPHLAVLATPPDSNRIDIKSPMEQLRQWLHGRQIVEFDGTHIWARNA